MTDMTDAPAINAAPTQPEDQRGRSDDEANGRQPVRLELERAILDLTTFELADDAPACSPSASGSERPCRITGSAFYADPR